MNLGPLQVRPDALGQRLEVVVPIPREEQIPQHLGSSSLSQGIGPLVAIPLLRPGTLRTNLRLDFDGVVVFLGDPPSQSPIPAIPVAPFREDGGAAFEIHIFG